MDVYQAVTKRRSIREFKDIPIAYNILEKCVNAARLAPSAMNCQLCEYIIIDDEQLLPQVFDAVLSWAGVPRPKGGWPPGRRPRAYIVILINVPIETEMDADRTNTNYDVALAAEDIILVALEQGLGSCLITSIDRDKLRQVLNIPSKYEIALMLALGFPDESPVVEIAADSIKRWIDGKGVRHVPKRRLEDITHRNRFPK
jgi:nitroreductase